MRLYCLLVIVISVGCAKAQPCPLVQDEFAVTYNSSVLVSSLPLQWIIRNTSCIGDKYVVTWGRVYRSNGQTVLGFSDDSGTWMDLVVLENIENHIIRGDFLNDFVPNIGRTFIIKMKVKVNLDLGRFPHMFFSDNYSIDPNSVQ